MATTITKSIGTTARDYSNLTTWEADIPANLVTADEVWVGEVYNDSEITGTATTTIGGHTTDAKLPRHFVIRRDSLAGDPLAIFDKPENMVLYF